MLIKLYGVNWKANSLYQFTPNHFIYLCPAYFKIGKEPTKHDTRRAVWESLGLLERYISTTYYYITQVLAIEWHDADGIRSGHRCVS